MTNNGVKSLISDLEMDGRNCVEVYGWFHKDQGDKIEWVLCDIEAFEVVDRKDGSGKCLLIHLGKAPKEISDELLLPKDSE